MSNYYYAISYYDGREFKSEYDIVYRFASQDDANYICDGDYYCAVDRDNSLVRLADERNAWNTDDGIYTGQRMIPCDSVDAVGLVPEYATDMEDIQKQEAIEVCQEVCQRIKERGCEPSIDSDDPQERADAEWLDNMRLAKAQYETRLN